MLTALRRNAMACVALPTCGLALAESERYLPDLVDRARRAAGRTARRGRDRHPHDRLPERLRAALLAEIGLVGKGPGRYNLYLGAAFDGSRLSKLYAEDLEHDGIVAALDPLFASYAPRPLRARASPLAAPVRPRRRAHDRRRRPPHPGPAAAPTPGRPRLARHLAPAEPRPARLAALAKLPIFLDLRGRRVVVAGGGEPVAWKAELLAAAGAEVIVWRRRPPSELQALAAAEARSRSCSAAWRCPSRSRRRRRGVAEAEGEEAARFAAARAAAAPSSTSSTSRPSATSSSAPSSTARRSSLSISTDGAAPILAQAMRRRIEAILPHSLAGWGATAKALPRPARRHPALEGRPARLLGKFVDVAFISQAEEDERSPSSSACRSPCSTATRPETGEVVIVGAGPGDPELLTMKAVANCRPPT